MFELAKSKSAGALFVIFKKVPASSATEPALHGVSYAWGSLNSVHCSARHSGSAVVATFLEESTTHRPRVQLTTVSMPTGGVSHNGIQPVVTAPGPVGPVCYHHMGVTCVNADYDFILAELLRFLCLKSPFQQVKFIFASLV